MVCDGLTGLPDAIAATWPQAIVQTCVLHLLRNTFRYASRQDWHAHRPGPATRSTPRRPKPPPGAPRRVRRRVGGTATPPSCELWENAWAEFVPFLAFDVEIRRIIYSTNAIESLNARFRRAVRARGHFPTEQAALKCLYLVSASLDPTGRGRARWVTRWKPP